MTRNQMTTIDQLLTTIQHAAFTNKCGWNLRLIEEDYNDNTNTYDICTQFVIGDFLFEAVYKVATDGSYKYEITNKKEMEKK